MDDSELARQVLNAAGTKAQCEIYDLASYLEKSGVSYSLVKEIEYRAVLISKHVIDAGCKVWNDHHVVQA